MKQLKAQKELLKKKQTVEINLPLQASTKYSKYIPV